MTSLRFRFSFVTNFVPSKFTKCRCQFYIAHSLLTGTVPTTTTTAEDDVDDDDDEDKTKTTIKITKSKLHAHHPFHSFFDLVGLPCPNKFHHPAHYNKSNRELHMVDKYDHVKHEYPTGSFFLFHCEAGYEPPSDDPLALVVVCQPDGHWSKVGDCKKKHKPHNTTKNIVKTALKNNAIMMIANDPTEKSSPAYKPCFLRGYTISRNINKTSAQYNIEYESENHNELSKPGSSITFACNLGFFLFDIKLSLKTICQLDGTWTQMGDCEPHQCWNTIPHRPLNGKREVGLVLNMFTGDTRGSHVNFTCNPMYKLVGRERIYCVNGTWEMLLPECRLETQFLCLNRPQSMHNAVPVLLNRVEFKMEHNFQDFSTVNHYALAQYVCVNGMTFQKSSGVSRKLFKNELLAYKNSTCLGNEKWSETHVCVYYF